MSPPFEHGRVEFTESVQDVTPAPRKPMLVDLGHLGKVVIHQASFVFAGEQQRPQRAISLVVGTGACPCGCRNEGVAFNYLLAPEYAREVAAKLVSLAEELETAATGDASAAIARARNGGAA